MNTVQEVPSVPARQVVVPLGTRVTRNVGVDAYRGLVMVLMMAEVLRLARVAQAFPGSWIWHILAFNQTHTEWAGCSLHDLIQPSFSFLVGVALPYSIASRMAKGATFSKLLAHTLWRAFALAALGIFLRSMDASQTSFMFTDTLTQIGLGYPFLFLLGFRPPRWAWTALGTILVGYWLAWALYPLPGPAFDWASVGVPAAWHAQHNYTGFAAHWNKNYNLGIAFDQWFLNLFPRPQRYVYDSGGYLTLSFIPTLGTMILGLIAGRWLRETAPIVPMKKLSVGRRDRDRRRLVLPLYSRLPGGKAHLDTQLDIVQRRRVLSVASWILLGNRAEAAQSMGVSAGGRRYELHRRVLHCAFHGAIFGQYIPYAPGAAFL